MAAEFGCHAARERASVRSAAGMQCISVLDEFPFVESTAPFRISRERLIMNISLFEIAFYD